MVLSRDKFLQKDMAKSIQGTIWASISWPDRQN